MAERNPTIPTVKIVNTEKKGSLPYLIINAVDFDPKKHKLLDGQKTPDAVLANDDQKQVPFNRSMSKRELLEVAKEKYGLDLNARASNEDILAELETAEQERMRR